MPARCILGTLAALVLLCAQDGNAEEIQATDIFAGVDYGIRGIYIPSEWSAWVDSSSQATLNGYYLGTAYPEPNQVYLSWRLRVGAVTVTAAGLAYAKYWSIQSLVLHLASPSAIEMTQDDRRILVEAGFVSRKGVTLGDPRSAVHTAHGKREYIPGCCHGAGGLFNYVMDDLFTLDETRVGTWWEDAPETYEAEIIENYPTEGVAFGYPTVYLGDDSAPVVSVYLVIPNWVTPLDGTSWGQIKAAVDRATSAPLR